jgi:hypothetical protein
VLQRCGVVKLQRYLTKNEYMKKENISKRGGGEYKFTSTSADGETETTHLSTQQLVEILHFEIFKHAESIDPNLKNVIPLDKWELELESSGLIAAIWKLGASTTESVIEYYKTHSPSVSKYIQRAFDPAITDEVARWLKLRDALRDEVQRRAREKQPGQEKRENSKLPLIVRQHTFQEVRNLGQAITDGATLQNWKEIPGEVALGHTIEGQPIETKLTAGKDIDWFGAPVTYDSLREELRKLTPEGVLLFQFALESVLLHQHATLSLDDLIREIGWTPKNREDRNQMRWQIYYWLCVFTNFTSHGTRPGIYKDPITKEKGKIITSSSYFAITDKERLEDSNIPLRVTITASKWIADHKNDNAVLQHFGNLRKLAGLPTGQPRGEYALCIGLATFQKWREDATRCETKRIGEQNVETVIYKPLARFDLLNMFRPGKFPIMDILKSDRPKRAQVYWNEAVTELKKRGVIGYYKAPDDKDLPRKGWQDSWLYGKNIEMRPFGDERQAAVELSKSAKSKRKRFRNAKP